jgi:hypothetical protein
LAAVEGRYYSDAWQCATMAATSGLKITRKIEGTRMGRNARENQQLAIGTWPNKTNQRQQMTADGPRHAAHWLIARSRDIAENRKTNPLTTKDTKERKEPE